MRFQINKKIAVFILSAIFLFVLDRFFKILVMLPDFPQPITIINNFFQLNFIPNYNIALSIPLAGIWLNFLIESVIIILLYSLIYSFKHKKTDEFIYLFFIILGATSNLADRLKYGYVIDYLDIQYFSVLNIADIMIVIGSLGVMLSLIRAEKSK